VHFIVIFVILYYFLTPPILTKFVCKTLSLKTEERMFKKIPQRSLPSSHIISLKESLKERTKISPLQTREKEIHLALISRKMDMRMRTVGNYIGIRDQRSSVERGEQRPLLQCNKILVPI
jgi:hypothetical protein